MKLVAVKVLVLRVLVHVTRETRAPGFVRPSAMEFVMDLMLAISHSPVLNGLLALSRDKAHPTSCRLVL
jgi:hypothetical protein